jgi:CheY-like chemotaxis protein
MSLPFARTFAPISPSTNACGSIHEAFSKSRPGLARHCGCNARGTALLAGAFHLKYSRDKPKCPRTRPPALLFALMETRASQPLEFPADRTIPAVVLYEEDALMRSLLTEWLSEAGFEVRPEVARDPHRTDPADLVILSIYMPKHAGALVRKVQAAHPGTPLIALSGQFRSGLSAAGSTAEALGVQQVIAKPLTRRDLLEAVRAMIGRQR